VDDIVVDTHSGLGHDPAAVAWEIPLRIADHPFLHAGTTAILIASIIALRGQETDGLPVG
jgi:hypothetical protein